MFVSEKIHSNPHGVLLETTLRESPKEVINSLWHFKTCSTDKHMEKSGFITLSNSHSLLCQQRLCWLWFGVLVGIG